MFYITIFFRENFESLISRKILNIKLHI